MTRMSDSEKDLTDSYHAWLSSGETAGKPLAMYYSLDARVRALITCADVPQAGDCDNDYENTVPSCPITANLGNW